MSYSSTVLLVIAVTVAAVFFALLVWYERRRTRAARLDMAAYPGLVRINRWTLGLRYAGVAVGLVAIPVAAGMGRLGAGVVIAPVVLACAIEAGVIVGEVVCFRAAREPGVAGLERRTVGRYLEWPLVVLLGLAALCVAVLSVWGWRLAWLDGRSFRVSAVVGGEDLCSSGASPFFGPYYSRPIGLALGAAVVLAVVAMAVVVRRPRNGGDPVLAAWDDALRRRSARAVAAALLGAWSATLAIAAVGLLGGQQTAQAYASGLPAWCQRDLGPLTSRSSVDPPLGAFGHPAMAILLMALGLAGVVLALISAAMVLADFAPDPSGTEAIASAAVAEPAERRLEGAPTAEARP